MPRHRVTVLTCVLCLATAMVWTQDRITEEDVLSTLTGKSRAAAPGHPLGVALHVTIAPQKGAGDRETHAWSAGNLPMNETLYKMLMPLARTLEAEVLRGSRFVIKLVPTSSLPGEDTNRLGQQLAAAVEHFLTSYFAIARERLHLQVALPHPAAEQSGAPAPGPQRWRLEVFRQE